MDLQTSLFYLVANMTTLFENPYLQKSFSY